MFGIYKSSFLQPGYDCRGTFGHYDYYEVEVNTLPGPKMFYRGVSISFLLNK